MAKPNEFDGMMHDFCVGCGFCGSVKDGRPLHVTDYIPTEGLVSADEFVTWLMIAEGYDPKGPLGHHKEYASLKSIFVRHMGAEIVNAKRLRSDYRGA